MSLFKSKEEKIAESQLAREAAKDELREQIYALENETDRLSQIAAKAEISGDKESYESALNSLIELNGVASTLRKAEVDIDVTNATERAYNAILKAMDALGTMAVNISSVPDFKTINKRRKAVSNYMNRVSVSTRATTSALHSINPANHHSHTAEEIATVKPLIDAARKRILSETTPAVSGAELEVQIAAEKNKNV